MGPREPYPYFKAIDARTPTTIPVAEPVPPWSLLTVGRCISCQRAMHVGDPLEEVENSDHQGTLKVTILSVFFFSLIVVIIVCLKSFLRSS